MAETPRRLRFALFTRFAPGGPPGAMWHGPAARDFDHLSLDHWAGLPDARELVNEEKGVFFIQIETEAFAPHLLDFVVSAAANG